MKKFFKQFSFPGHIGSHVTPETPGSIHEGGELGYSLSHAYGMAFDNPDLDRRVRRRRRRGGDRAARDRVALEQVHQPDARRRGAADPEPQRLQDREPDDPRAHQPRRARGAVHRLRLPAVFRRRQRPDRDAPEDGRDARARRRRDPRDPEDGAPVERRDAPALADDRAALAEGMDRAERAGRSQARGLLATHQVPIADVRDEPRAPEDPRGLDAELPARGAVRRARARSCPSSARSRPKERAA